MKKLLPKACVIFIGAFIITECAIAVFFSQYVTNKTHLKVRAKMEIARQKGIDSDVLIFGDSAVAGAVQAVQFEEETGYSCFNFGIPGYAACAGTYFLFQEYLQHNTAPRYIIIMNAVDFWHKDLTSRGVADTIMINFPGKFISTFTGIPRWHEALISSLARWVLPSQRYQYELRKLIKKEGDVDIFEQRGGALSLMKKELMGLNGSSIYREHDDTHLRKELKKDAALFHTQTFSVSPLNMYYFDRFLSLAQKHETKVFVCFPPMDETFYQEENNATYIKEYKKFVYDLEHSYKGLVKLLTKDFYVVKRNQLSLTPDHLTEDAARNFTEKIARMFLVNIVKDLSCPKPAKL